MLNNDLLANNIIQKMIDNYGLGNHSRIGLLVEARLNVGDIYFFVSELTYVQMITGKRFVIVVPRESTAYIFSEWHIANGADIEKIVLTLDDYNYVKSYLQRNRKSFSGVLELYNYWYDTELLSQSTTNKDIYQNLTRPIFPFFDRKKYVETYKIVPGKTVFVIPESNCQETLPDYFWTMSIGLFKMLGYQVLVNVRENAKNYGDAICCFPPFDDVVALCNLCGIVYSIRTGLVELIAAETDAKVFIFGIQDLRDRSSMRPIASIYPHIDNSDQHIIEIQVPRNKMEFSWIKGALDSKEEALDFMRENIYLRDKLLSGKDGKIGDLTSPSLVLFKPYNFKNRILDFSTSLWSPPPFCEVKYNISLNNNTIILGLDIRPFEEYKIHIALKSKKDNNYIISYVDYDYSIAYFDPEDDGDYCASVHIVHPISGQSCLFNTKYISLFRPIKDRLKRVITYEKYVDILAQIKDNTVIFITSRDAHTDWEGTKNLRMDKFPIQTDIQKAFRHSWLCVIDGGKLMRELTSKDQEVSTEYEWDGNTASLISVGYNVHRNDKSPASININGEEVCVNKRGLNFVVWDKENNCLLDSVCFDTYWDSKASRISSI